MKLRTEKEKTINSDQPDSDQLKLLIKRCSYHLEVGDTINLTETPAVDVSIVRSHVRNV